MGYANLLSLRDKESKSNQGMSANKNGTPKSAIFSKVFARGEDIHTLRLKSELFELRVGYANLLSLRDKESKSNQGTSANKNGTPKSAIFIGRGSKIRTYE